MMEQIYLIMILFIILFRVTEKKIARMILLAISFHEMES